MCLNFDTKVFIIVADVFWFHILVISLISLIKNNILVDLYYRILPSLKPCYLGYQALLSVTLVIYLIMTMILLYPSHTNIWKRGP